MNKNKIESLTPLIAFEYMELVRDLFQGITSTPDFLLAFNSIFSEYQMYKKMKFDPKYIRETKAVSCTSAAMIIGTWHLLSQESNPEFYIEQDRFVEFDQYGMVCSSPKASAHCKVSISNGNGNTFLHLKAIKDSQGKLIGHSVREGKPVDNDPFAYTKVSQIGTFVARGISVFGLRKHRIEELLKTSQSAKKESLQYVGKHDEFFNYLKWCYLHSATT